MSSRKDPAVLIYVADFLVGTMFMTNEQVGIYIRLLLTQHQHGHMTIEHMKKACGGEIDPAVLEKFKQDEAGLFYNRRMDEEMERRGDYSVSRKNNSTLTFNNDNIKSICFACAMHVQAYAMHSITKDKTITKDKDSLKEKGVEGGKEFELLKKHHPICSKCYNAKKYVPANAATSEEIPAATGLQESAPVEKSKSFITFEQLCDEVNDAFELSVDIQRRYSISEEKYQSLIDAWLSDRKICGDWNEKDVSGKMVAVTQLERRKHINNYVRKVLNEEKTQQKNGKQRVTTFTEAANRSLGID